MSAFRYHRLPDGVAFRRVAAPLELPPETEAAVARAWQAAASSGGSHLRDEMVFRLVRWDSHEVSAAPVHYRYFWAQRSNPGLLPEPITLLAVTGLVTCEGRLVLGKRASWVTQDPGLIELVPSGSVNAEPSTADGIDIVGQFRRELEEELGIDGSRAAAARPIGLLHDEANRVLDVIVAADLACTAAEILARHAELQEPEYTELLLVEPTRLPYGGHSARLSPATEAILAHFPG